METQVEKVGIWSRGTWDPIWSLPYGFLRLFFNNMSKENGFHTGDLRKGPDKKHGHRGKYSQIREFAREKIKTKKYGVSGSPFQSKLLFLRLCGHALLEASKRGFFVSLETEMFVVVSLKHRTR